MKTILAPTDFSKAATNAINYAVELAKIARAKLILFHVYSIPAVPVEAAVVVNIQDVETAVMEELKKTEQNILAHTDVDISIECAVASGLTADEINRFALEHKVDLVVMGMHGEGFLAEQIFGSTSTDLIRKGQSPVLVIGKDIRFSNPTKIALASDYFKSEKTQDFALLKEMASLFKSHIFILNVLQDPSLLPSVDNAVAGIQLNHALSETDHSFHYIAHEDVVAGINQFIEANNIDLLFMIPREHSFLHRLLNQTHTRRMAFHALVPLLAIHE